jgi:hypothetical protein
MRFPLWLKYQIQRLGAQRVLVQGADSRRQAQQRTILVLGFPETKTWIETGTFQGTMTRFFANHFATVCTIEPSPELFLEAKFKLRDLSNVSHFKGTSERRLREAITMSTSPPYRFGWMVTIREGLRFVAHRIVPWFPN